VVDAYVVVRLWEWHAAARFGPVSLGLVFTFFVVWKFATWRPALKGQAVASVLSIVLRIFLVPWAFLLVGYWLR
jgi:hypothetical protein